MVSRAKHINVADIQKRAEQIRSHWSMAERLRRTGLPPDVPARLRDFMLDCRQPQWCAVGPHVPTQRTKR